MKKILVTESALREFVNDAMDSSSHLNKKESPVRISPVVATDAAEVDPTNSNFVPQNKAELLSVLRSLCNNVEDQDVPSIYVTLKNSFNDQEEDKAGMKKSSENVHEAIRLAVRKILSEAELPPVKKIPPGVHGAEYMQRFEKAKSALKKSIKGFEEDPAAAAAAVEDERTRKNVMMTDVGGASFKDIAKEVGFAAESGAKQAVEKAIQKAKFVMDLAVFDPDTLEILVLQSMADYIDALQSSGELSQDEVKLLKDNPAIVRELDGFRDFLQKDLKRAAKTTGAAVEESKKPIAKRNGR